MYLQLGMVVHAFSLSIWKTDAGRSLRVQGAWSTEQEFQASQSYTVNSSPSPPKEGGEEEGEVKKIKSCSLVFCTGDIFTKYDLYQK